MIVRLPVICRWPRRKAISAARPDAFRAGQPPVPLRLLPWDSSAAQGRRNLPDGRIGSHASTGSYVEQSWPAAVSYSSRARCKLTRRAAGSQGPAKSPLLLPQGRALFLKATEYRSSVRGGPHETTSLRSQRNGRTRFLDSLWVFWYCLTPLEYSPRLRHAIAFDRPALATPS